MNQHIAMAFRNVLRNFRRSSFAAATIAIGGLALIAFVGYMLATFSAIRESTIRGGVGHFQIARQGQFDGYAEKPLQFGLDAAEQDAVSSNLERDTRVRRVVPRLNFGGLISNGDQTLTFQGVGVQPNIEQQAFGSFQVISSGHRLNSDIARANEVLLGKEMARRLGVKPGDQVTLMTSTVKGALNAIDVTVAGLVATGNPDSELYLLQIPIAAAQELLRTNKISLFAVLLQNNSESLVAMPILPRSASQWEVREWRQLVPVYDQVVALYRNQFVVFGSIIALVVFLSVGTTTLTSIFERSREIGTLRAMGISESNVRLMFSLEGLILGFGGSVAAGSASFLIINVVNKLRITMPPPPGRNVGAVLHLEWDWVVAAEILTFLIFLCGAASWIISRRVARMQIVSALASA